MHKTSFRTVALLTTAVTTLSLPHRADAQTMEKLTNKAQELMAPIPGKTDERL